MGKVSAGRKGAKQSKETGDRARQTDEFGPYFLLGGVPEGILFLGLRVPKWVLLFMVSSNEIACHGKSKTWFS
jgi:hypothetical protein